MPLLGTFVHHILLPTSDSSLISRQSEVAGESSGLSDCVGPSLSQAALNRISSPKYVAKSFGKDSKPTLRSEPPAFICVCRLRGSCEHSVPLYTAIANGFVVFVLPSSAVDGNYISRAAAERIGALAHDRSSITTTIVTVTAFLGGMSESVAATVIDTSPFDCDLLLGDAWIYAHQGRADSRGRRYLFVDAATGLRHYLRERLRPFGE